MYLIEAEDEQKAEVYCWQEGGTFAKRNPLGHWFLRFPNGKPFTENSTCYLYAIPEKEINANPNL
jgi:hypothetical protein